MKANQTLPRVVKLLPQPFEFDNKRKSVEFNFVNNALGSFIVTEYVTGERRHGTFKVAKARNNVKLFSTGIETLRNLFSFIRDSKHFGEA